MPEKYINIQRTLIYLEVFSVETSSVRTHIDKTAALKIFNMSYVASIPICPKHIKDSIVERETPRLSLIKAASID